MNQKKLLLLGTVNSILDPKFQTTLFLADLVSQNQISSQQQGPQQLEDNLPTKQDPLFSVDNLKSKQDIQLGLGLSKNTQPQPSFDHGGVS